MSEVMQGLKYTKEHEWAKADGNIVTVGITDYAQHALTDIVFVELPEKGKKVEKMKSFSVLESVKSVSDVFAPVSGEIVEVNKELSEKPQLINEGPYGKGWIAKIKARNISELNELMSAEQYKDYVKTVEEKGK